jgi:hypothetical protein
VIDPPRLRDGGSGAPAELSTLFQDAKKPEPLTPATDARLLAQVAALSAAPFASLLRGWLIAGGAVLLAGTAALIAQRPFAPGATPSPVPRLSASPSTLASAPASVDRIPPAAVPEAQPPPASKQAPAARTEQVAPAEAASSSEDALAGEAKLLNQAHAAMSTDPPAAYAFASEHARRYPRGQLAAERELILVQALAKLGRTQEAEARGRALRKSSPSSIYGERLDTVLKGK